MPSPTPPTNCTVSTSRPTRYIFCAQLHFIYGANIVIQVAEFVKPTEETLSVVSSWLSENGISSTPVTPAGDILQINIPVEKANQLLSTEFSVFTHVDTGSTSIRTLEYSIPAVLQGHIDNFHPTTSFTRPLTANPKFTAVKKRAAAPVADIAPVSDAVPASCASTITPACLQVSFVVSSPSFQCQIVFQQAIYGIPTTPATQSTNKLGVSGFIEQFANQADLKVRLFLSSSFFPIRLISIYSGIPDQLPHGHQLVDGLHPADLRRRCEHPDAC